MILLDTHAVIWLSDDSERLSIPAKEAITKARAAGGLAISSATLFELALLIVRGRIAVLPGIDAYLNEITNRFAVKHITVRVAHAAAEFSDPYPRDPMDRLIGATALVEGIPLVTADERIRTSGQVQTIW